MRFMFRGALAGLAVALLASVTLGQPSEEPPAKALRYLELLRQRPSPGYLFDRFYNEWLQSSTSSELERFLRQKAEAGDTRDRLLLAFLHAHEGRDVEAIAILRQALNEEPASAAAWYHKAQIEARVLDFETALADLEQALAAQPDDELAIDIRKLQGRLLIRSGQREAAREVWTELLADRPEDEQLHEDLVELLLDEGLFDQALATNTALIERTTDAYQRVLRELRSGDILQRAGRKSDALAVYAGVLEAVGAGSWTEQEVLSQIEQVFRREDDLAGLDAFLSELIEKHPQRLALQKRRVRLLAERGEAEEAVALWREILARTPGDRDNREAFAELLVRSGRVAEAVEQVELLLEQTPEDGELWMHLAELHHEADAPTEAAEAVARFLSVSDRSLSSYLRAGRALEKFELPERAEQVYDEAVTRFAEVIDAHEARAEFLHRQDRGEEALAVWRRLGEEASEATDVVRVARAMAARGHAEPACDLMLARVETFGDDPTYLGELCTFAMRSDRSAEAVPWALRRVALSDDATTLPQAIGQATTLIARAEQVDAVIAQLQGQSDREVAETCLLASLLEMRGDSPAADAVLAEAGDDDPRIVRQQVELRRMRRDWAGAAAAMRRLIELPDGRRSSHYRDLVNLYQRDLQLDEALKWIEPWKRLAPTSPSPWLAEADLHTSAGRIDDAIRTLRQAMQQFEDAQQVAVKLAQLYRSVDRLGEAQRIIWRLYEQASTLDQKLSWVRELAQVARAQGKLDQLVEHFEQRRDADRQSLTPYLMLAEIHRVGDDHEERRKALLEASRVNPDDVDLLLTIAHIEEQQGDLGRAIATLERAMAHDPQLRAAQQLVRLYVAKGRESEAMALLEQVTDGDQFIRGLESVGLAMAAQADWPRLVTFLEPYLTRYPNEYGLRYLHAVALEEDLRDQQAIDAFLALLQIEQSSPAAAPPGPASRMGSHFQAMAQLLPPDTLTLMEQAKYHGMAYQYRHQFGRMVMHGGLPGQLSILPTSLEQARMYAIAHLQTLAELMEPAQRDLLASRMRQHGVERADLLLSLGPEVFRGQLPVEVIESHSDDPTVLALAVMLQVFGRPLPVDAEFLQRAYETFREDRRELAMLACLVGMGIATDASGDGDGDGWKPAEALREILPRIEQPSIDTLHAVAGALSGQRPMATPTDLPDDLRQALIERLITWYPQAQHLARGQQVWIFATVASAVSVEDGEALRKLLEEEVARAGAGGSGGSSQATMMRWTGRGRPIVAPLEYPPHVLPDLPPHVMLLIAPPAQGPRFGDQLTLEPLADQLDQVRHPVLRAVLAIRLEKPELAAKTIDQLMAQPTPSLSGYLLAASQVGAKEPAKALALLDKARHLPMTSDLREMIDGAMVAYALEMDEPDETSRQLGQHAALRLRQASLDPQQREQLVLALEDLGLKDEASKLANRPAAAPSPNRFLGHAVTTPHSTQADAETITKLLAEGKKDQAVRRAQRVLEQYAQALAHQAGFHGGVHHRVRDLTSVLAVHQLEPAVIEAADPGPEGSTARQLRFAMLLELLDEHDQAIARYEQVLSQRRNLSAQARLAGLYALKGDADKAATLLLELPPAQLGHASLQLVQSTHSGGQVDMDRKLQVAETVIRVLEGLPEQQGRGQIQHWNWVSMQLTYLEQNHYSDGERLPALFQSGREVEDKLKPLMERRRETYKRLCRAMMQVPAVARLGFSRLVAQLEREGADLAPLVAEARRIISTEPTRAVHLTVHHRVYSPGNPDMPRFRSPETFLVQWAAEHDDVASINELIEALEASEAREHGQVAEVLADLRDLYFGEPSDFLKAAQRMVEGARRGPRYQSLSFWPSTLIPVIEAWEHRQLREVDLASLVLEQAERGMRRGGWPLVDLQHFVAATHAVQGPVAVDAFLDAVADLAFAGAEDREAHLTRHFRQGGYSNPSPNAHLHMFLRLLQQCLQDPALAAPTLKQLEPFLAGGHLSHEMRQPIHQLLERASEGKVDDLVTFVRNAGMLADGNAFRSYPCVGNNEGRSVMELLVRYTRYNNFEEDNNFEEARKKLIAWLDGDQGPDTLGADLLRMGLEHREFNAEVVKVLQEHAATIAALDERGREHLAAVVPANLTLPADADPALRQAVAAILELREEDVQAEVEALLAVRHFQRLPFSMHELERRLATLLKTLLPRGGMDTAVKLLEHSVTLYESAVRSGRHHSHQPLLSGVLEDLLSDADEDVTRIGWVNDLLHRFPDEPLRLPYRFRHGLRHWRMNELTVVQKQLNELEAAVQAPSATPLFEPLLDELKALNHERRAELTQWLAAELEQRPDAPVLRTSYVIVQLLNVTRSSGNEEETADSALAELEASLLPMVDDATVAPGLRARMVSLVLQRWRIPYHPITSNLATRGVDLLSEALALEQLTPGGDTTRNLLHVLLRVEGLEDKPQLVQKAVDAILRRHRAMLRQGRSNLSGNLGTPSVIHGFRRSGDGAPLSMLRLALQTEQADLVRQVMGAPGLALGEAIAAWTLLTDAGETEMAAQQIQAHWQDLAVYFPSAVTYSPALAANIPAVLEQIDSPDLRLLAEVALAATADPDRPAEDPQGNPLPTRSQRLDALAQRVVDHDFSDDRIRLKTLLILVTDRKALIRLGDVLEEETSELNYAALVVNDQTRDSEQTRLLEARLALAVLTGESEPLVEARKQLDRAATGQDIPRPVQRAMQGLGELAVNYMWEHLAQMSLERLAQSCDALRAVARPTKQAQPPYRLLELTLMAHAAADRMDDWHAWREEHGDNLRRILRQHLVSEVADRVLNRDEVDPATRVAMLARVFTDATMRETAESMGSVLEYCRRRNLLEKGQWAAHGQALCEAAPVGGVSWADWAAALEEAGKTEQAAKAWQRAREAATATTEPKWQAQVAERMIRAGRLDDAEAVLGSVKAPTPPVKGARERLDAARKKQQAEAEAEARARAEAEAKAAAETAAPAESAGNSEAAPASERTPGESPPAEPATLVPVPATTQPTVEAAP